MLPRPSKLQEAVGLRITVGALILLVTPALSLASGSRSKKVIYYGWGLPDTQYVRDHWREMEEMPFDGLGILVAINRKTWQQGFRGESNQLGRQVMGPREFHVEEFRETIKDLKSAHWRSFTDNFLPVALSIEAYAQGLNWFDDGRWRIVVNNFRVLSRIAAEARLKGLMIDPEHYGYPLFSYSAQRKLLDRCFEDCEEMAHLRGQQVMRAVAAELPDSTLLSFYAHSLVISQMKGHRALQDTNYALLPAFYDGLLDAMPNRAHLIDGYEFSYGFKRKQQFVDGYNSVRQEAIKFSATPTEYRRKMQAGFGLWIDRDQQFKYFSPEEFQQSLTYALEVSDRYVWIYGQSPRFFPPSGIPSSYIDAIAAARREVKNK